MTRSTLFPIVFVTMIVCAACGGEQTTQSNNSEQAARASIKKATKEAYASKKNGNNQNALVKFEQLHKTILQKLPADRYELASNLDDQASVLLRIGKSDAAKKLYTEARAMLEKLGSDQSDELLEGIDFRLRIVEALQKHGVTCAETLAYDSTEAPYFPDKNEAYKAIAKVNDIVRDCFVGPAKPVTVGTIITGDGRIIMTNPRGPKSNMGPGLCVAKRLLELGKIDPFPKFGACFRPFNYPFVVGG